MNHFDEIAGLLYLEGQLDQVRAQELTKHVDECSSCAALLNALKHESSLLSLALTEQNESIPARFLGTQGRTFPVWVWTLAFAGFAAGAYWLWTDTVNPWMDQLSNAGFRGMDLVSTILFSGAFWEGWGEMLSAVEIGAFVIVVLTALGLLRRRSRRSGGVALTSALLIVLTLPHSAAAAEYRRGRPVLVSASETIHNDLIVEGPAVRIDGTVEGDVFALTRELTVTGHITGDIIGLVGQLRMEGAVDGNVRVISNTVSISGSIGKNVSSLVNTIDLTSSGTIQGGVISVAGEANLDGKIHRDVLGIIARTFLNGAIGGQFWVRGGSLVVASSAEIGGDATFRGREQPVVAAGAKLAHPIHMEIQQDAVLPKGSQIRRLLNAIFGYAVALLVGILLTTLLPGFARTALRAATRIGLPIGVGALTLLSAIFLLVGGVLLLFVGVGAGLAGVLLFAPILYLAQVIVSAWLGNKILGETPGAPIGISRIAVGLLIIHLAGLIPFLGTLVWLTVFLWGSGALWIALYRISQVEKTALIVD